MARKKAVDNFNIELFRKCVAHFDDGEPAERGNAVRIAMKMCEDAGLHFYEGCELTFTKPDEGNAELEEALTQQRAHIEQLEADKAALKDGVDALNDEMQKLMEHRRERGHGFKGLVVHAWAAPQFRLALACGLIVYRMAIFILFESSGKPDDFSMWMNLLFAVGFVFLLGKWSGLQYEQSGVGPVFMKLIIFCGLSTLATACLFGFGNWRQWYMVPCAGDRYQYGAFALMLAALVLAASNFSDRLCDKAENGDGKLFGWVKEWVL
jgi:hypothetical protein